MKQKAPTNYSKTMCGVQCHDKHRGNQQQINQCYNECIQRHSSEVFKPHSQISEKLAASAKNLYDENEKLLLIAEEMHSQDLMYL
ncbi:hypothetical protein [Wolbachia endosymbiont of Rhagoletis cingulata]|uniref:hypothetical protein n=1 Tax=Wolbachia endosymbiont of Rhagoletis cingulata TaxID=1220542 RepID=UPI003AF3DEB9